MEKEKHEKEKQQKEKLEKERKEKERLEKEKQERAKKEGKALNDKVNNNVKDNVNKVKASNDARKKEEENRINKLRGGLKKIEPKHETNVTQPKESGIGGFKSIKDMIEFNIKKNASNNTTGLRKGNKQNKPKK